jgi:hypothetical protein
VLQLESILLVFLKLAVAECYLDLSITQGEQTRVDGLRRKNVKAVVPGSTEDVLYEGGP